MKVRLGRLRVAEVLMTPVALGLVALSVYGTWDSSGAEFGFIRLVTLLVGAVGLVCVAQAVLRTSPAGSIAAATVLCVGCPIVLVVLLISYASSETAEGLTQSLAQIGVAAMFVLAVWALKSESRGFSPDPAAQIQTLAAPEKQVPGLGG